MHADAPSPRLVVADDEALTRDLFVDALRRQGYTVYPAADGREAIALAQTHQPDVIVTDLKMPGCDGLEVLRRVKALDNTAEVVVVTAFPDLGVAMAAMRGGAFDFLLKPLPSVDGLIHSVQRALARRALTLENQALVESIQRHERELEARVADVTGELQRDKERLERLATFSRRLSVKLDIDHVGLVFRRFFLEFHAAWQAHLFVDRGREGVYNLLSSTTTTTDDAAAPAATTLDISRMTLLRNLGREGVPHLLSPDAVEPAERDALHEALISPPALLMPLLGGESMVGLLAINLGQQDVPDDQTLRMLELCGETLALALHNCLLFAQARDQAQRDGLTGLFNHTYFRERLNQELRRAVRYDLPVSLVMLDIDNFKQVNDRHGHLVGDEVLRRLGRVLERESRDEIDVACRYGGEEFAVLLPSTDREGAANQGERLRASVEADFCDNPVPDVEQPITVSVGVAANDHAPDGETLIQHADDALYEAKRQGKNRRCVHEGQG